MKQLPRLVSLLSFLLSGVSGTSGICFAAQAAGQAAAQAPSSSPSSVTSSIPKICLDAQTTDPLTREFADRLRETVAASGSLSLATTGDTCNLQLHVPGNLLRFQTAGSVMVSTVVIVTSPSGQYLTTSITACRADDLEPCAVRAVAVAKLAVLVRPQGGT